MLGGALLIKRWLLVLHEPSKAISSTLNRIARCPSRIPDPPYQLRCCALRHVFADQRSGLPTARELLFPSITEEAMADKTNFTKEEWTLMLESKMLAVMAVTAADPSGL